MWPCFAVLGIDIVMGDDKLQVACQRCWEMVFVYNTNNSILGRIPLVPRYLPVCRLYCFDV